MKLPQYKNKEWNYLALAFAIPTICFLGIMLLAHQEALGCVLMFVAVILSQVPVPSKK